MIWQQCRDLGIILFLGSGPLCLNINIMECSHNTRNTLEEGYGLSRRRQDSISLILAGNAIAACGSLEVWEKKSMIKLYRKPSFLKALQTCKEQPSISHRIVSAHIKEEGWVKWLRHNDLVSGSHSKPWCVRQWWTLIKFVADEHKYLKNKFCIFTIGKILNQCSFL